MKTSKVKAVSKQKKTSKPGDVVIRKKVATNKSKPSEEEIREKAREIYNQRIELGKYGTAENDWLEAEELLKGSKEI